MSQTAADMQLAYTIRTDKPFDEVADALENLPPRYSFRTLAVHNVQETLAEKGFTRGPLKIIEVCNAGFAHEALAKEPGVALFMPCRYSVYDDGGTTVVSLARPMMISQMMPGRGLEELAGNVEETLKKIMHEAAGV